MFKLFGGYDGVVIDGIEAGGSEVEHVLNLIDVSRFGVGIELDIGEFLFEQLQVYLLLSDEDVG